MGTWHRCIALAALTLAGCAHHPADNPADPLEPVNRKVWAFNSTADKYVLKPVAKGYVDVTPDWMREGVTNFFDNLGYPKTIINDALQAKFKDSLSDTGRFLLNSVYGIGGFIDVASRVGLDKHDEDFGQTLGRWGVGEGWFLMLPLLGPSTNRDLVGYAVGIPMNPTHYLPSDYDWLDLTLTAANIVNIRANALPADALLEQQFDTYLFIRTAYLQHRQAMVYDGNPPPEDLGLSDIGDDTGTPADTNTPAPAQAPAPAQQAPAPAQPPAQPQLEEQKPQ
jgi:phospholipid-binding lipoprotein MlaA